MIYNLWLFHLVFLLSIEQLNEHDLSSDVKCIFYRRDFMPENIDMQIGEVVLCTFDSSGKLISNIPVGGGYGDSITFSSNIHSVNNIEVNYIKYGESITEEYAKYFEINDIGEIIEIKTKQ